MEKHIRRTKQQTTIKNMEPIDLFGKIIHYQDTLDASAESFGFEDCELLKDFGPLKKGKHYFQIWFMIETSECQVWKEDNETSEPSFKFNISLIAEATL